MKPLNNLRNGKQLNCFTGLHSSDNILKRLERKISAEKPVKFESISIKLNNYEKPCINSKNK
jgi:hypothetical protein